MDKRNIFIRIPSEMANKCKLCRNKLLVPMTCRCGDSFCIKCRLPEMHHCDFDFQTLGQQELKKQKPITAEKLERI